MGNRIALIAGLGNPGPRYADTRHNAGFWFVERLADRYSGSWREERRFKSQVSEVSIDGNRIWLLAPQNFMNRSGETVGSFANYYRIPIDQILVVHDELDLPPGKLKLKQGGGAAGHNGLRDTSKHIGPDYLRLRLGIGHPGQQKEVVNFVLKRPPEAEATLIDAAIDHAIDHIADIISGDLQSAMNALHSRA
ncbi:MAG TPA: aminoacyl-tRNA hydrolase [Gammaproteobacteria bacterium]|nr:aminoacyl-tRNA hydrolase [Gammaproteobacteria bacterium]